jgi:hypothetical protein
VTAAVGHRPAIVAIDEAYADPEALLALVQATGPYWSQARYVPAGATLPAGHPLVAPGAPPGFDATPAFRADWFRGGAAEAAGAELAHHEPFLAAARKVHRGSHVVPLLVHVNLNAPGRTTDRGHLDVPLFRGLDNRSAPGWLLLGLARAGMARRWRLPIATAISWLYRGEGGGLTYWPDGPGAAAVTVSDLWNRALVLDTDVVHHRVDRVGSRGAVAPRVSRGSTIATDGDRWVVEGAQAPTSYALDAVRVSISWKAAVFADEAEHEAYRRGDNPLTLDAAADLLATEVRRRGGDVPSDVSIDDVRFADAVEAAIPRVFPPLNEDRT